MALLALEVDPQKLSVSSITPLLGHTTRSTNT